MLDRSPLARLLACNRGKGSFRADAGADGMPTLWLYDVLVTSEADAQWGGGVAADTFARALAAITAPEIAVRVNSPGGDVFAGVAMAQAMRGHPAKIALHIDGYAASAATFLLAAADTSVIAPGGFVMIHDAWTFAMGDGATLRQTADLLEQLDQSIAGQYVARAGGTLESWLALMDAETWFCADDAVGAGLVDAVAASAPRNSLAWDVSAYRRPPAAALVAAPAPADPAPEPAQDEDFDRRHRLAASVALAFQPA